MKVFISVFSLFKKDYGRGLPLSAVCFRGNLYFGILTLLLSRIIISILWIDSLLSPQEIPILQLLFPGVSVLCAVQVLLHLPLLLWEGPHLLWLTQCFYLDQDHLVRNFTPTYKIILLLVSSWYSLQFGCRSSLHTWCKEDIHVYSFYTWFCGRRQRGWVVSVLDLQSGSPAVLGSSPAVAITWICFWVAPSWNPRPRFSVNRQLVYLRPAGIRNNVMFNLNYLFGLFARLHKHLCYKDCRG